MARFQDFDSAMMAIMFPLEVILGRLGRECRLYRKSRLGRNGSAAQVKCLVGYLSKATDTSEPAVGLIQHTYYGDVMLGWHM